MAIVLAHATRGTKSKVPADAANLEPAAAARSPSDVKLAALSIA
ncbi:hypothetical protein AKJ09_09611 [Labilithrix luteola]|uniref:Uncharacterized protein n=1 Tax=Labilithrix luteola TaxID=1391654 RepID=A0A0K1QB38_9BACT|nr:hypothetical protein AKJ09_09611 [Labilithrix luteola]